MVSRFFFDSSAVVKRYRTEIGSSWVRALTDPTAGHTLILSEITLAEVAAALAAMQCTVLLVVLRDENGIRHSTFFWAIVVQNTT